MRPNKSNFLDSDIDRDWIHTEVLGEGHRRENFLSVLTFILVLISAVALVFIAFQGMFRKDDLSNLENMDKVKQEQQMSDEEKAKEEARKKLAEEEAKKIAEQELVYTVVSGDTLAGIADEFGVDYNKIAEANELEEPYSLDIGQQLRIPGVKKTPEQQVEADKNAETTYTVKPDDTLAQIGISLGIDFKTIAELNGITSPYNLEIGQVLKIPAK